MIIYLQREQCIDLIRLILSEFGEHTIDDIVGYFPQHDYDYILGAVHILLSKKEIDITNKNGIDYYLFKAGNNHLKNSTPSYREYKKPLDFIRTMINSTNEKGLLKNNIPYICKSKFPCALYFECNNTLYDLFYLPHNNIEPMNALINRADKDEMDIDTIKNRIIICDATDDFEKVNIQKVKYKIIIEQDGSFTFEG